MGYYDIEENVEQYIQMAEGFDGRYLIKQLERYLPEGRTVLELGMGPGKDLELLNKKYIAAGSDNSDVFVNKYLKSNPGSDVFLLDALTIDTDRKFDALYSNKVLSHLSYEQMKASFLRQSEILSPGGIVLHSFWYGNEIEIFDGLVFYQLNEAQLESIVGDSFKILELRRYTEMETEDSLYGIFRPV